MSIELNKDNDYIEWSGDSLNKDNDYIEWSSDSFQAQALWQSDEVTENHIWKEHSFQREDTNSQFSYLLNVSIKKKNHDSEWYKNLCTV